MKSGKLFYYWHQSKQITKKCTITSEIYPIAYKMYAILMNSENSITSQPHVLILKPTNTLDLRTGEKIISLSNLSIYQTWKKIKNSYNDNQFKLSAPTWNDKFELPRTVSYRILYQIFKIILSIF